MKKRISIVIPVLNEEKNIGFAYERLVPVLAGLEDKYDFEIVFMDNHSSDGTFEALQALTEKDRRVRVIRFARNVGYQRSILSGYLLSGGDAVIQLDCDMQDPPELISDMVALWENGNDVVYGIRRSRKEGPIITFVRRVFYKLVDTLSEDHLPQNVGDFRLIDRRVVEVLRSHRSKSPYLRGQIAAAGFRQIGFEYDRSAREHGETKFSFGALVKLSIDAIVGHSVLPLRFASYFGFVVTAVSLMAAFFYLAAAVVTQSWPPGFATLVVLGFLNIGLMSLFLGIIGEYMIRVIEQVTIGPISVIEQRLNIPEDRLKDCPQILSV